MGKPSKAYAVHEGQQSKRKTMQLPSTASLIQNAQNPQYPRPYNPKGPKLYKPKTSLQASGTLHPKRPNPRNPETYLMRGPL